MATTTRRSPAVAIICVILAILCAVAAVYYWAVKTSLLASNYGHHAKHAILFTALAIIFLLGAILFRPKRAVY